MEETMNLKKDVFSGTTTCLGCGALIGLKLALQVIDKAIVVNSTDCFTFTGEHVKVPFIHAGTNASAVARGLYTSINKNSEDREKEPKIIAFASEEETRANLPSLVSSKEDIIYICYSKYGLFNPDSGKLNTQIAKQLSFTARYSATASVAFPNDFIKKLENANKKQGFKFIELLAPCPIDMGFDTSNTIEVGRMATETGLWPLYEIENNNVNLTKRPIRLEPIERFFEIQKLFKPGEEQIKSMQLRVNKNWKLLTDGRML